MPLPELSLPPWMNAGEPAGAPLLRGAQAGQAIASSFLAARQQKLREREQAVSEEQQQQMMPLRMEALRMQQQAAGLELAEHKRKADAALQTKAGFALLADKMATIDWSDPADRASIWSIGAKYPDLLDSPEWNRIQQNFINSDKAQIGLENANRMLELQKERNKLLEDKQGTATMQDINAAQKLRQQAEALRSAGDTIGYQDKIRQAELLETHVAPKGITIQTGTDDQGRPITTTQIGGGAPTTGTQTMAQQKQISFDTAVEGINDVLGRLRPADVGVAGVVGENVFDRWLGQIDPSVVSGKRVSNRRALGALRETLFQALSPERIGGSGFSNKDAERIKEIADSLGAAHSYGEVATSLNEIRDTIRDRARIFAERTGQPIPESAKTEDELRLGYLRRREALQKAVDNFTMTQEQANEQGKSLQERLAESLKRYHGIEADFK